MSDKDLLYDCEWIKANCYFENLLAGAWCLYSV